MSIHVGVYRLHVIVTWDTTADQIAAYAGKHKCPVSPRFAADFQENIDRDVLGLCMELGDGPDVLVWLRDWPRLTSGYGTLYHELYHATDFISEARNLDDEAESRAYIFEYLTTQANRFFWSHS